MFDHDFFSCLHLHRNVHRVFEFDVDDYERSQLLKFPEIHTSIYLIHERIDSLDGAIFRGFVQSLVVQARKLFRTSPRRIFSYTPTSNSLITQACDVISPNDL